MICMATTLYFLNYPLGHTINPYANRLYHAIKLHYQAICHQVASLGLTFTLLLILTLIEHYCYITKVLDLKFVKKIK